MVLFSKKTTGSSDRMARLRESLRTVGSRGHDRFQTRKVHDEQVNCIGALGRGVEAGTFDVTHGQRASEVSPNMYCVFPTWFMIRSK